MRKKYKITSSGCDDEIEILMELEEDQFNLLMEISKKSYEMNRTECMPTLSIEIVK